MECYERRRRAMTARSGDDLAATQHAAPRTGRGGLKAGAAGVAVGVSALFKFAGGYTLDAATRTAQGRRVLRAGRYGYLATALSTASLAWRAPPAPTAERSEIQAGPEPPDAPELEGSRRRRMSPNAAPSTPPPPTLS